MKSMCKRIVFLFIALAPLHFIPKSTFAQVRSQIFTGTRPLSMGEAFVAVADDGNAIYWNPAGLARMERIQASFNYADLFGLDIDSYYASLISRLYFFPPLTDYITLGVDWFGISINEDDGIDRFEFSRKQFNLSLGLRPPQSWPILKDLSLGVNAKFLSIDSSLDGFPEADADGRGWDVGLLYDLGALRVLPKGLSFGLMVHDVTGTDVKHHTAPKTDPEEIHRQNLRWGFSYRPFEEHKGLPSFLSDPVFALDFDDRVHFGLEFWLADALAFRAGVQKDLHTGEKATFSFGLGLKIKSGNIPETHFDYALTNSPALPNTDKQFGISFLLRDDPRLIRFEDVNMNDVFASLYKHYASEAGEMGKAILRNIYKDTLTIEVTFKTKPYIKDPVPQTVKVPPNRRVEVPLRATLDEKIIDVTSRERKTGKVEVAYTLPRRGRFVTSKPVTYTLHGRGSITWDDAGKAAAFVTKEDPCLSEFAKSIVKESKNELGQFLFTRKIRYALQIYESLRALGFNYVPDATTPFYQVGGTEQVVDNIDYPAKLLASQSRSGDCDDLSVLYATLLESVGVETALLSTPTHLFMMFNTDLPARRLASMPVDTTKFVSYKGSLWMPVETTVFPAPFLDAWSRGAYKSWDATRNGSLEVVDVELNQRDDRYPPASVTYEKACSVEAPNVKSEIAFNLNALQDTVSLYLVKFESSLILAPEDFNLRNRYATILGQNGDRIKARNHLHYILRKDSTDSKALNNLGNLEFIEGHFSAAESFYVAANRFNPYNKAGTYLNLAFLYEMMWHESEEQTVKETLKQKSFDALKEASFWLSQDDQLAIYLLGLPDLTATGKGEAETIDKAKQDTTAAITDTARTRIEQRARESWLVRKAKAFANFIKTAINILKQGRPLNEKVVLEPSGSKGAGETDEDRAWLLWWSI